MRDTYSEEFRFECEVNEVLSRFKTREERKEYLDGVEKKRGFEAANKLREGVKAEWIRRHKAIG